MDNNNNQENAKNVDNVKDQPVDNNREITLNKIRQEAEEIRKLTEEITEHMKHNDGHCYCYLHIGMDESDNNKN